MHKAAQSKGRSQALDLEPSNSKGHTFAASQECVVNQYLMGLVSQGVIAQNLLEGFP